MSVTFCPCCHLFSCSSSLDSPLHQPPSIALRQNADPLNFLFGKCKELADSGFPQRHTQEALLKPRLNPTLLCPALHATIHLEDSLIPWRGCCTLTPQGHSHHSIGRYSNLGSVTESQGETLYCFLLWNPCRAAGEIQSYAFRTVSIVTFSSLRLASWLLPMIATQFLLPVETDASLYLLHV